MFKNIYSKVVRKLRELTLLSFGEHPDNDEKIKAWNRRWRWRPEVGLWNGRIFVGFQCEMIESHGVQGIDDHVESWAVQLVYNPRKWKVTQAHVYYDGPHCAYQLGPFEFRTDGMNDNCRRCNGRE